MTTCSLLEVKGASVAFGGLRALDDVSLHVEEHQIVGLIGPNGAGKTTLFNVISGLQRADSGDISFEGEAITHLSVARRARLGIGRTFQNLGLVTDETVLTNLLGAQFKTSGYHGVDIAARPWRWLGAERRLRRAALAVAEEVGVVEHLDERVEDLSFAAARLVEVACILVGAPRLLLLDEPTTGLDVVEVDQLKSLLRMKRDEGRTVLIVAHDVGFVMSLCDYIYVLAQGRVLTDGPPRQVQNDPDVIAAYLGKSA